MEPYQPTELENRSVQEVIYDHLHKLRCRQIEADLETNYATDAVLLTSAGIFRHQPAIMEALDHLRQLLPDATYAFHTILVEGEVAYLEWTGTSPTGVVARGADSYVVRAGKISAQTSHYSLSQDTGLDDSESTAEMGA